MAEPFAEIHPDDASELGITAADLVEVKSPRGRVVVRALVTERTRPGEVYVPMHWTDQFASKGRIGSVVAADTDPFSGQPGSKFTPVAVSRKSMDWYGFAVLKTRPTTIPADYWAIAPITGGFRLEFAGLGVPDLEALLGAFGAQSDDRLSIEDAAAGWSRQASWREGRLEAAIFMSRKPVEVSRQWTCGLLSDAPMNRQDRLNLLAGRPPADRPDPGALVCSCFQVGCNQISDAVRNGADSVQKKSALS